MSNYDLHRRAADIVREAGGQLIGRTRLQKVTYLTQLAGFSNDFSFEYRHYGPYSEDLANAMEIASGVGLVTDEERRADWGGRYSIYSIPATEPHDRSESNDRARFITAAAHMPAVELELAATAAFLFAQERVPDPWEETARRKPEKAAGDRLDRAKAAYRQLLALPMPGRLPAIV